MRQDVLVMDTSPREYNVNARMTFLAITRGPAEVKDVEEGYFK